MPIFLSASLRSFFARLALASLALASAATGSLAGNSVNIYSYREPKLIDPLLQAFTAQTGIETNVVYSNAGLIERMAAEGANSPADVLLTNEFGWLSQAVAAGVTAAGATDTITQAVPAELRDPNGHWIALTRRARIVYASKERVKQDSITYEELADPKWKGKICIRSGQHTYNTAMIASMIANIGEEKTEAWLTGLRANLARKPAGGDREQVRDVHAGLCDIAIGNTYYMAAMLKSPEQRPWADAVKMLFPNAEGRGVHVNISGMARAAHAPNGENATKLMEFLVSKEAQKLYAEVNGEYPVVPGVPASELVSSWGPLKADPLPLSRIGELRKKASEMVDRVRFDQGPNS